MRQKKTNQSLSAFLEASRISQREFASKVGSHQSIISRIVKGTLKPSLKLALKIDRETSGAVPIHSWAE